MYKLKLTEKEGNSYRGKNQKFFFILMHEFVICIDVDKN
jgi:hypothetical protein